MSLKTVFILGISSDIGKSLAEYYANEGYTVVGTYRKKSSASGICSNKNIHFFKCDVSNKNNVKKAVREYKSKYAPWNIFISCIGTMEPIGNFFTYDFNSWEDSVVNNSTAQLRFLHSIYSYRCKEKGLSHVAFFAGGGTNSAFKNYSAYCASKILLIKMCELLDDENDDLNVFIIGPGWVRTKIHNQTLESQRNAGQNYGKTVEFLQTDVTGTTNKDIYDCINWCIKQGKNAVGGRNFSVVHDKWRNSGKKLSKQLLSDPDKFKLRRFKNI